MQNKAKSNFHLTSELEIYSKVKGPGYAVLIDAPWGAGKTYFVKKWLAQRKDAIYFSVYGVSTPAQFETVLLEAIVRKEKRLKFPKMARNLEDAAKHFSGVTLGLSDLYRRVALRSAPPLLVIDDLERSNLSANEAFGIINDQLEHNEKNVILISHQEALIEKWNGEGDKYSDVKEKVIGKTLSLRPSAKDIVSAFASPRGLGRLTAPIKGFLGRMAEGDYKSMLLAEADFIVSVFEKSGSNNLRLLRQSLRDFSRIYPTLMEVTSGEREKVRTTLASYLALSIAYHRGKGFDAKSLAQEVSWKQAIWSAGGEKGGKPEKTPIEKLRETYAEVDEVNLEGLVISKDLAVLTVSRGIFDVEIVRTELLKSPYIGQTKGNLWRVLWRWMREDPETVELTLQSVLEELRQREISDPVVLLHVFCILRDMELSGVELNLGKPVEEYFQEYVEKSLDENQLPVEYPKSQHALSITESNNTGLGFIREDEEFFRNIVTQLEEALDRSFWIEVKSFPEKFSNQFSVDPRSLMLSLDDRGQREGAPNYAHIPVLGFTPVDKMVDAFLKTGPDPVSTFIGVLGRRIERLNNVEVQKRGCEWPSEAEWLQKVRDELEQRSRQESSRIASVQMSTLVRYMDSILT